MLYAEELYPFIESNDERATLLADDACTLVREGHFWSAQAKLHHAEALRDKAKTMQERAASGEPVRTISNAPQIALPQTWLVLYVSKGS